MAKYSHAFKLRVVNHYLSNGEGTQTIAKLFNISDSIVRKWIAIYKIHGKTGLRPCVTHQTYSVDFKLDVIKAVMDDGLSYSQVLAKFKLKETGMISTWLRRYREHGIEGLQPKPKGRSKIMSKSKPSKAKLSKSDRDKTSAELLEELAYLRAENAFLKKLRALRLEQQAQEQAQQQRLQGLSQD